MTGGAGRITLRLMEQLSLSRIQQIGLSAAQSVAGGKVKALKVRSSVDSSDKPAYYLAFLAEGEQVGQAELGVRIAVKVRDDLIENGDSTYPFVRLLAEEEWERQ